MAWLYTNVSKLRDCADTEAPDEAFISGSEGQTFQDHRRWAVRWYTPLLLILSIIVFWGHNQFGASNSAVQVDSAKLRASVSLEADDNDDGDRAADDDGSDDDSDPKDNNGAASGRCLDASNLYIWNEKYGHSKFGAQMSEYGRSCWALSGCVRDHFVDNMGYSATCAACFGDMTQCSALYCMFDCITGDSQKCNDCAISNCMPAMKNCAGAGLWEDPSSHRSSHIAKSKNDREGSDAQASHNEPHNSNATQSGHESQDDSHPSANRSDPTSIAI